MKNRPPWSWTGSLTLKRLVYINYEVKILGILYIYLPNNMHTSPIFWTTYPNLVGFWKSGCIHSLKMNIVTWKIGGWEMVLFLFHPFPFGAGQISGAIFCLRCRNCQDLSRCTSTLVECAKPMEVSNLRVFFPDFHQKVGEKNLAARCVWWHLSLAQAF